ncbi:unnamed protein product [Paramecium octaurelia]|uniref:Uncharacterized protein n=1 Tax=Paramecium octaurelia TaxID=43137 RepID=A0A8S1TMN8_PAROT|nr:unnamed protein product [Paramecium octaurelia]CAD8152542.1 unnamed protein product [Paramecium octaurelia]
MCRKQIRKNKLEQFATQDVMKLVSSNYNLNCLAEKVYKDFIYTYQHKLDQNDYDVLKLNPMRLCKSFGFDISDQNQVRNTHKNKLRLVRPVRLSQKIQKKILKVVNSKKQKN